MSTGQTNASETAALLQVRARAIPIPTTISPEAQANLALRGASPPERYDIEAFGSWHEVVRHGDSIMQAHADRTGAGFRGKVERHEWDGVAIYEIVPEDIPDDRLDSAIVYVHGGAYLFGGGALCAASALHYATAHRCRIFSIDYRMPPDHPYPAAIDDAVAGYLAVTERYAASKLAVIGLSAGGGLAAATMLRLRDEGRPLPAALILLSPEADLTEAGDMFRACVYPMSFSDINALYADGHDLAHPYLSPVHGDFTRGYPPTMIQSGTRDFFLSSCALMHRKLRRAGIDAELHVWEAMPHVGFGGLSPEDADCMEEQIRFIGRHVA